MSGELQTIPARHGVATFVPRGRTIKIINTYGKQVVSTWAFSLHEPPSEDGEQEGEEDIEGQVNELKEEVEGAGDKEPATDGEASEKSKQDEENSNDSTTKETESTEKETQETSKNAEDPPEQAPDAPEPSSQKQPQKRTWSSYIPSIPYRSKGGNASNNINAKQPELKDEKEKNEAASKTWSSYMPTGKGFSSYVPNVQLPDSKGVASAFKSSHYRDPNKSYAEQLYDFSKTPVGAGSLAAATGSGTASSLYAAYNAYTKLNPGTTSQPPMEFLSLPHTRASSHRLVPRVDDTLFTNLRNPILTLVEDTTPGAHDTLTAACDAALYTTLGVDKPLEHGSCAENLVLALKELNEKAGLKGTKAVGADVSVNVAPTPLHLFMNAPLKFDSDSNSNSNNGDGEGDGSGVGAKAAKLSIQEPQAKKRSYVRFRAERDVVLVLSACPMDVGSQNGGKCMAANFMVEEATDDADNNNNEDLKASTSSIAKPKQGGGKRPPPKKLNSNAGAGKKNPGGAAGSGAAAPAKQEGQEKKKEIPSPAPAPRPRGGPRKPSAVKQSANGPAAAAAGSTEDDPPESGLPEEKKKVEGAGGGGDAAAKPKKKPKKLERRGAGA